MLCIDCDKYYSLFSWKTHANIYPTHKRQQLKDLETTCEVLDLNADTDEIVTVTRKRKSRVLNGRLVFMRSMRNHGLALADLHKEWNNLSKEEKDEYSRQGYFATVSSSEEDEVESEEETKEKNNISKKRKAGRRNGFHEFCSSTKTPLNKSKRQAWDELSKDEKSVFTKRAMAANLERNKDIKENDDEDSYEDDYKSSSSDSGCEEPPRKVKRGMYNGFIEYIRFNGSGHNTSELAVKWRALTEDERDEFTERARKRYQGEHIDYEESNSSKVETQTPEPTLSHREQSIVNLVTFIHGLKQKYISEKQYLVLEEITVASEHFLKSTVFHIATILKEHINQSNGHDKWSTFGVSLVNSVVKASNK
jgi:hypothetical protein